MEDELLKKCNDLLRFGQGFLGIILIVVLSYSIFQVKTLVQNKELIDAILQDFVARGEAFLSPYAYSSVRQGWNVEDSFLRSVAPVLSNSVSDLHSSWGPAGAGRLGMEVIGEEGDYLFQETEGITEGALWENASYNGEKNGAEWAEKNRSGDKSVEKWSMGGDGMQNRESKVGKSESEVENHENRVGNGEAGVGNGENRVGNGECGVGNGEYGVGNGEYGVGNGEIGVANGETDGGNSEGGAGDSADEGEVGSLQWEEQEPAGIESGEMPEYGRQTSFQQRGKVKEINLSELSDYETLIKRFYTIDSTTMAGSDQLNAAKFMAKDLHIEKNSEGPQILIYHTHSQEGYSNSVAGDRNTTVVGVGEELARILREDYGYQVLHHLGEYDKPSRNEAYSRALPKIEAILEDNPSIEVVIDLHRDEMPENTRLVTEIDGKKTAKFMFFNGLSRTKRTGNLDYLYNVYLEDNLAFSFQMEKAAQEYFPDLTRKIYLKGYRYNMHLKPRTLLIELGAQNNTLEEAINACGPLAQLLDLVLRGEE